MEGSKKRSVRGVSLIELLVVLAIMSLVMIALLTMYSEGQKYFINESAHADTIEKSRYPMAWLSRDIKEATRVEASCVYQGTTYTTSADTFILQVPSLDANGLVITGSSDIIIYSVTGGRLVRSVDGLDGTSSRSDSSRVLADNVSAFSLVYYTDAGTATMNYSQSAVIDIAFSSRRKGVGRNFEETQYTRAKLRNYVSL